MNRFEPLRKPLIRSSPIWASDNIFINIGREMVALTFICSLVQFALITVQSWSNFIDFVKFHRNFALFNPF